MIKTRISLVSAAFIALCSLCDAQKLSMQIDTAYNENYLQGMELAQEVCVEYAHFSFPWNSIEHDIGNFNFVDFDARMNEVRAHGNIKIELNLPPLNMMFKEFPLDLQNDSINSSKVVARYKIFLDSVFNHLQGINIELLNIGNEHAPWLTSLGYDDPAIGQFMIYFAHVSPYAKNLYAAINQGKILKTGTTFTWGALTKPETAPILHFMLDEMNTDVVSVNYYGIEDNFKVKTSEQVKKDIDTIVAKYNDLGIPIYFTECGYPSGDTCNSSETLQAEFVKAIFESWDKHSTVIDYVSFFKLTDWTWETVNWLTNVMGMNGEHAPVFREYLRTLGFRNIDGSEKAAMDTLRSELAKRSWCESVMPSSTNNAVSEVFAANIFPNPAQNGINITTNNNETTTILLYNLNGTLIKSEQGGKSIYLDVSVLSQSVYLLKVIKEGYIQSYRFIKY